MQSQLVVLVVRLSHLPSRTMVVNYYQIKSSCLPPHPVPTSHVLASDYYPTASTIVRSILSTFGKDTDSLLIDNEQIPTDQPNLEFVGPF